MSKNHSKQNATKTEQGLEYASFSAGVRPHRVEAVLVCTGPDLSLTIGGGDSPHIGAVALAMPRPSLTDARKPSASASVLCVTGHKEDELARSIALDLARTFHGRVQVSAGLHIDNASIQDIEQLQASCKELLKSIKSWLNLC